MTLSQAAKCVRKPFFLKGGVNAILMTALPDFPNTLLQFNTSVARIIMPSATKIFAGSEHLLNTQMCHKNRLCKCPGHLEMVLLELVKLSTSTIYYVYLLLPYTFFLRYLCSISVTI